MEEREELLTTGRAAEELQVSVQTVRRWEKKGHLVAVRTPGGQRRFRRSDVEAVLAIPACTCDDPELDGLGACTTCLRKPLVLLQRPAS
jgi:excisionase family DNA binding protein